MTSAIFVLLAALGGLGASTRLIVDGVVRARTRGTFPVGTAVINLTGSLLLGLLTGLVARGLPETVRDLAGTGFLGGYTTFSTASFETVRLAQQGRWFAFVTYGLGVALGCVLLAAGGYLLGVA